MTQVCLPLQLSNHADLTNCLSACISEPATCHFLVDSSSFPSHLCHYSPSTQQQQHTYTLTSTTTTTSHHGQHQGQRPPVSSPRDPDRQADGPACLGPGHRQDVQQGADQQDGPRGTMPFHTVLANACADQHGMQNLTSNPKDTLMDKAVEGKFSKTQQ